MKLQPFEFLLLSLATYRLALMVSKESGPFWMFKHLRRFVKREAPKKAHMDEGIECIFCVSAQFGILVAGAWHFLGGNPMFWVVILALSLSAVSVILNQAFTKGEL